MQNNDACADLQYGDSVLFTLIARLCTRTVRLHYTMKRQTIAQLKTLRLKFIQHDNRWLYCLHPTPLDSRFHRNRSRLFSSYPASRNFYCSTYGGTWYKFEIEYSLHTEEQYSFNFTCQLSRLRVHHSAIF